MPHFVYSINLRWTFGLVSPIQYCGKYCYEYGVQISVWQLHSTLWISLGFIPILGIARSYGHSVYLFEEIPYHFPQDFHHFKCPPATHKGSNFSRSFHTVLFPRICFNNSHYSEYEVACHLGWDLHLASDWWYWLVMFLFSWVYWLL